MTRIISLCSKFFSEEKVLFLIREHLYTLYTLHIYRVGISSSRIEPSFTFTHIDIYLYGVIKKTEKIAKVTEAEMRNLRIFVDKICNHILQ